MNGLRKYGVYIQWNFIQTQRGMKICHLQVNGWNWREKLVKLSGDHIKERLSKRRKLRR
jgi:hypothetical protein